MVARQKWDLSKPYDDGSARQFLKDRVRLAMCLTLAELGTCARRKVGTIFVDANNMLLAEGYNGVPPGDEHCIDNPCAGAGAASGTCLDLCGAIHAEANALKECKYPRQIHTIYCTDSPCESCVKQLAGTSATRIVFVREYPHPASRERWLRKPGRSWVHIPMDQVFGMPP